MITVFEVTTANTHDSQILPNEFAAAFASIKDKMRCSKLHCINKGPCHHPHGANESGSEHQLCRTLNSTEGF